MKNIDELSVPEKISLYNCLYKDLAGKGIDGDTELAHVNKDEMTVLRSMGGSGTINPETNLIQFKGGSSPAPTTQTVTQQPTFSKELQPFIQDIFGKAKAISDAEEKKGYQPFTGPRLADFTDDQTKAFEGIRGLVGASDPYFDRSQELVESSAAAPTSESIGALMNPYIQNVIDVEKREASRQSDIAGQNLAGKAVGVGGFGGSREAILAAELGRNTQQQLGDIQSRGTAAAFEDAQRRFAEQKERESGAASNFMNLGTTAPAAARSELSALEAIGATQQGRSQQGLDIAQQEFEIDRTFDQRNLQDYSAILRGYSQPLPASSFTQRSTQAPGSSFAQNAAGIAGLGISAANLFKPQDGFTFSAGGLVGLANGGMVAKYQAGKKIGNTVGPDIGAILGEVGYSLEDFKKLPKEKQDNIIGTINEQRGLSRFGGNLSKVPAFISDKIYNAPRRGGAQLVGSSLRALGLMPPDKRFDYENISGTSGLDEARDIVAKNQPVSRESLFPEPKKPTESRVNPLEEAAQAQPIADPDPYGLKAYMAAKTKASEGKTKALDAQIGQEQSKKMQVFADKLLAYAGAPTDVNEFQKLSQGFKGINKELADIEQGSYAAEVAKSSLDLEDEKENLELRMKLKAIQIKASKAGLMSAKDLANLSEFAVSNQAGAEKVRDNPKTDPLTRRILTDLISVLPKSNLGTGNGNRNRTGPYKPAAALQNKITD